MGHRLNSKPKAWEYHASCATVSLPTAIPALKSNVEAGTKVREPITRNLDNSTSLLYETKRISGKAREPVLARDLLP